MAYVHAIPVAHDRKNARSAAPHKPGLFRRLLDAMVEARTRQVERGIALYLGGSSAKFTDEVEREIERRFLSTPSRL